MTGEPADAKPARAALTEAELASRETAVENRESVVGRREVAVQAREAASDERLETRQQLAAAADERDVVSGARDAAADQREHDLDRADMLDPDSSYGAHWPERRNAGIDRAHSRNDRSASHADRLAMIGEGEGEGDGVATDRD